MDYIYGNGGFYPENEKARYEAANVWPATGFKISEAERNELLAGERLGKSIQPGPNGRPVLVELTPSVPAIPRRVPRKKGKLALLRKGYLQAVLALVAAADEETRIEFEDSEYFERDSVVLQAVAAGLNLSESDLDELFSLAATL